MSDSIVIIPTYNEKENAEAIVRAVMELEPEFHVLIVDDGSPDGTADIIKSALKPVAPIPSPQQQTSIYDDIMQNTQMQSGPINI